MTPPSPPAAPASSVPPKLARKRRRFALLRTLAVLGLGAVMLSAAAQADWWLDTLLLGLGGLVITGFGLLWTTGYLGRGRPPAPLILIGLACSPMTIYPLGALIALRFLLFPADGWSQGVGIVAGLLFLSPIILIIGIALMFMTSKHR